MSPLRHPFSRARAFVLVRGRSSEVIRPRDPAAVGSGAGVNGARNKEDASRERETTALQGVGNGGRAGRGDKQR